MRTRAFAMVVLALSIAACSDSAAGTAFDLTEFSIEGAASLSPGSNSLQVTNRGEFPHTLVVTESDGSVVEATSLIQPGETVDVDLDLQVGTYSFTCRIVTQTDDGRVVDHYEEGMTASVNVER